MEFQAQVCVCVCLCENYIDQMLGFLKLQAYMSVLLASRSAVARDTWKYSSPYLHCTLLLYVNITIITVDGPLQYVSTCTGHLQV